MARCILRALGENFNVDLFLDAVGLVPDHVFRKGRPRFPGSYQLARKSGFHLIISESEGATFETQVDEAIAFLKANEDALENLGRIPGLERVWLDFSVPSLLGDEVSIHCEYVPPELLFLAGKVGLGLELSLHLPVPEVESGSHKRP